MSDGAQRIPIDSTGRTITREPRDQVLAGLRRMREDVGPEPRRGAEQARDEADLNAAIALIESLVCLLVEVKAGFRQNVLSGPQPIYRTKSHEDTAYALIHRIQMSV